MKFRYYKQLDKMDCGPTCLRMVANYYGRNFTLQRLRDVSGINREGVSLLGISKAAEVIGFRTNGVRISIDTLRTLNLPCIVHWNQNHFVILYKVKKGIYYVADPAKGIITYNKVEFSNNWISDIRNNIKEGIILTLEPTPAFYENTVNEEKALSLSYIVKHLYGYKQLFIQLFIGLCVGSVLQLILPFLTQQLVDTGINTRNLNFVYIILIAQSMLMFGRLSVEFIRSWILLHISTRINIAILTDFIIKLMKLPMVFFETRMTGDIMQRMNDQARIQNFLTGSSLNIIFSLFNLVMFGIVLACYNLDIFFIFLASSIVYTLWILLFLKKRRVLDFKIFDISAENQSSLIQLIGGIQEIKLNNCEQDKRWEWERIQASMFNYSVKNLSFGQVQQAGAFFINEAKNIIITFIVAKSVIDGQFTLGGMMAIQYIIGQLNSPIEQMLGFLQQLQDAKISLERLNEIHQLDDEEPNDKIFIDELPPFKSINLINVSFSYPGVDNHSVLSNINLTIPEGKTTAIVGMSGSGKTTILKLLLRFYECEVGEIKIGKFSLNQIRFRYWRERCGIVMQDGFIFSDSIAKNIAVGDEYPNKEKLRHAIQVANISDFIESLPLGINTKIGQVGNGISQGQKQRILIARAVYKNPEYIFFDEATNALDANNEKTIMENLQNFFEGRTVVVVAHRLSTVKNADKIVVLHKGEIIEEGTHSYLTSLKGEYYKLVKNQLDLDY